MCLKGFSHGFQAKNSPTCPSEDIATDAVCQTKHLRNSLDDEVSDGGLVR